MLSNASSFINKTQLTWMNAVVLLLLSLSFAFSDWMFGLFSISEYILVPLAAYLFITRVKQIPGRYIKIVSTITGFLIIHNIYQVFLNPEFSLRLGMVTTIKLLFYIILTTLVVDYLNENQLGVNLQWFLNLTALILIVIGAYIILAIRNDWIYEFFWFFTETHYSSFYFRGPSGIIRMRSLFSEPAHFGYFLNSILAINMFTKKNIPAFFNIILFLGILFTLSYSAVTVAVLILLLTLIDADKRKKIKLKKRYILVAGIFIMIIFFNFDVIYETLILRTIDIFSLQDNSVIQRLLGSWQYISGDSLFMGNGAGHTPIIFNNYAYVLSDYGIIAFISMAAANIWLIPRNYGLAIFFLIQNFQKGGYLSPIYWLLIIIVIHYSVNEKPRSIKYE